MGLNEKQARRLFTVKILSEGMIYISISVISGAGICQAGLSIYKEEL